MIKPRKSWMLGAATLACTVLWFALLAHRPLFDPDEGRYAEIPREMLSGGDWVIPHLNALAYLEKPPLQYWLTALTYRVLGQTGVHGAPVHRACRLFVAADRVPGRWPVVGPGRRRAGAAVHGIVGAVRTTGTSAHPRHALEFLSGGGPELLLDGTAAGGTTTARAHLDAGVPGGDGAGGAVQGVDRRVDSGRHARGLCALAR